MRVLVVDSDSAMVRSIQVMLQSEEMQACCITLGEEAIRLAAEGSYDIMVLELQLPDMSGFEVIKTLRARNIDTPILVLSGNTLVEAKVKALWFGADDYLIKPFFKDELVARLQAVVRRTLIGLATSKIRIGELVVDIRNRSVVAGNQPVHLTGKEYQILELMVMHQGTPFKQDWFLEQLYGKKKARDPQIIDVFISKLRSKITAALTHSTYKGKDYIRNVRGKGYELIDPAAPEAPSIVDAAPVAAPA